MSAATSALVQGNVIGLDANGAALPNRVGIRVQSPNVTIGGTAAGAGNVIVASTTNGIQAERGLLSGTPVTDANNLKVFGNLIGTNATGSSTIGNTSNGMSITDVSNITIGSFGAGPKCRFRRMAAMASVYSATRSRSALQAS